MKNIVFLVFTLVLMQVACAQNYKLGKVSKAELEEQYHPLDSTANAAYLFKKRRTYFSYIQGQGFNVITEVHERIKIYNKDGYDRATKKIKYYSPENGKPESVSIKDGKTFSIVGGKTQSIKLNKKDVFVEKRNKYWSQKKFTMPNISDGCVIEWKYTITSPYKSINDVVVQHNIPVKRFESSVETPEYYEYGVKQMGYLSLNLIKKSKESTINFTNKNRTTSGRVSSTSYSSSQVNYKTNISRIEKEDIPALNEEPYVNNMNNYRTLIDYELTAVRWPNEIPEFFSKSWEDVSKTIIKSGEFGGELKKTGHLKDDIEILKTENKSFIEKIESSLKFVKSKIKWNGMYGKYPENGLRKAYKEGTGNIGDINLTLVAVLQKLGIETYPVLVSTRNNGIPLFPTLEGINYVIVLAKNGDKSVLLDASEKYSLPNVLPLRAMNWRGIVLKNDKSVEFVNLEGKSISLKETNLSYKIADDGFVEGLNRVRYENLNAINYRNGKAELTEDDLISKLEESNGDIEIVNFRLSNKTKINKAIVEMYTFEKEDGVEIIGNKMYITPMLFTGMDENPFKLETRDYPIDYGTPWKNNVKITFEIPDGYTVDTLPENIGLGLPDELGKFVYSIKADGNAVAISTLLEINQGIISASYYEYLKDFFKQVVAKQTEKIVLTEI